MLFYAVVATASYFAGIFAYISYLSYVYDQGLGSDSSNLIAWTLPPYLFIILPFYTLMFRWSKTAILLRIALLTGLIIIAATSVPFMMGFGIWRLRDLFSPEIGLFMVLFASSGLVFTIGSVVAVKQKGYLLFMLAALLFIVLPIYVLAAEAEKNRPVVHRIPEQFHGTVVIHQ